jgi:hypothetical protein
MMKKLNEIQINHFQLNVLLNVEQKEVFDYLLNEGVYCRTFGGTCSKGVEIKEIHLNSLNDIMVVGKCKACNGDVVRIMEFGENKEFFNKANEFRESVSK